MRTLIKNGTVVTASDTFAADVWIENDGLARGMSPDEARADLEAKVRGVFGDPAGPVWPIGCLKTGTCSRHGACMYLGCVHLGREIRSEIEAETARRKEVSGEAMRS